MIGEEKRRQAEHKGIKERRRNHYLWQLMICFMFLFLPAPVEPTQCTTEHHTGNVPYTAVQSVNSYRSEVLKTLHALFLFDETQFIYHPINKKTTQQLHFVSCEPPAADS